MADGPTNGNGNGGKWWLTWAPAIAASVVVVVAVGNYFATQGSNQTTVAGLMAKVDDLQRRMGNANSSIQALEIAQADDCRQLSTVEVQMGTVETIINKTQVANQRDIALLWDKAYSQQYPSTFYAVNIPHEAMPCLH